MKRLIIACLIIVIAGTGAYFGLRKKDNGQKFKTEKVALGGIKSMVTATGTMNAVTTVLVGTQVSGTIKHLYADFNSMVKKGQILAQIDPATFEAQVEQARANLAAAQANVEKAQAARLDTGRILERNKNLFARNLIAKSDFDTAETNDASAAAQVKAALAQVQQTRAALNAAETNLMYTRILSPVDGMVISRNVDVGQTVAASFQTPTLFTIAQDLTKMQIDTNVDEADIGRVSVGQQVEFYVDAYPDTMFRGTVSVIRNAPIVVQNVVSYDVVIKVDNSALKLKPGMTANVSIVTAVKEGILRVPNAALRFTPPGRSAPAPGRKGPGVWIVRDQKPKRLPIKAGVSDGTYTQVLSGELKEGDEVIVTSEADKKAAGMRARGFFH